MRVQHNNLWFGRLMLFVLIYSCSMPTNVENTSKSENTERPELNIKNFNKLRFGHTVSAKSTCDSTLKEIFGDKIFENHILWNIDKSFINCDSGQSVALLPYQDSLCNSPRHYDLTYTIIQNDLNIFQFRMVANQDKNFATVSPIVQSQLEAYSKYLNREFMLPLNEIKKVAEQNGFIGDTVSIELFKNNHYKNEIKNSEYWKVDTSCVNQNKVVLLVDPDTGDTSTISLVFLSIL